MKPWNTLYFKQLQPTTRLEKSYALIGLLLCGLFILIPFLPDLFSPTEQPSQRYFSERVLTITLEVLCYCILALGLNLVTGMTGLLELGYVLFVSIGAYTFALMYPALFHFQYKHLYLFGFIGLACLFIVGFLSKKQTSFSSLVGASFCFFFVGIGVDRWLQTQDAQAIIYQTSPPGPISCFLLFLFILVFCGIHAAIWGIFRGIPVLKLSDDYFAIVTFAFYEIVLLIIKNEVWLTEGPKGINNFQPGLEYLHRFGNGETFQNDQFLYLLILFFLGLTIIATYFIQNSRIGRALFALKADELSAKACGINIPNTRLTVFAISGFIGGIGGALMAIKVGIVSPNNLDFWVSVIVLCCLVLGGMGHIRGVLIGTIILIAVQDILKDGIPIKMTPEEVKTLTEGYWSFLKDRLYSITAHGVEIKIPSQARILVFGIVMVLVMIFRPKGLLPRHGEGRILTPDEKSQFLHSSCSKFHLIPQNRTQSEPHLEEPYMLEIRGLSKNFGGVHAVKDVTERIARGKITSLIGPNGAGKTTLFNMVTNMISPSRGKIIFHSKKGTEEITHASTEEITYLGIARTFQNIRLFQDLSVLDNVKVGLHSQSKNWILQAICPWLGLREEMEIHHAAIKYLDFVGLLEYAHQTANCLSYGHQRKLEIARALAANPELLLLDEPAAGMNPQETKELTELIQKIKNFGITIFLIEHDMSLVMEISDHIFVLDGGTKICSGSPEEVKNDPLVICAYLGTDEEDNASEKEEIR